MRDRIHSLIMMTGPGTALQELLYGFIMALIFVNAVLLGVVSFDSKWQFILVVLGMNATWGAIDGIVFYYLDMCD